MMSVSPLRSIRRAALAALCLAIFPFRGCNARLHSQKEADHENELESSKTVSERRVQVDNWLALQSSFGTTLPPLYERLNCPFRGHAYVTTHLAILIEGVVAMPAGLTDFLAYTYRNQTIQNCDPNFRVIVEGPLLLDVGSSPAEGIYLYEIGVGGYGSTLVSALEAPASTRRLIPAVPGTILDQQIGQFCNILQIMGGENWGSCVDCECPYDGCYCSSPDAPRSTIGEMELKAAMNEALQVPRDAVVSQILGASNGISQIAALQELILNDCSMCNQAVTTLLAYVDSANILDSNRVAIESAVAAIINEYNCLNQARVSVVSVESFEIDSRATATPSGGRRLQMANLHPFGIRITFVSQDGGALFATSDAVGTSGSSTASGLRCALDTGIPNSFFISTHAEGTGDSIPQSLFEDLLNDAILSITSSRFNLLDLIEIEEFECPVEEPTIGTTTLLVEFLTDAFLLDSDKIAAIEDACVLGYNSLAVASCEPSFLRIQECIFTAFPETDLTFNGLARLDVETFSFANPVGANLDPFRAQDERRLGEGVAAPMVDVRALQMMTSAPDCFCSAGSEFGSRPSIEEFISLLNNTGIITGATQVTSVPCGERRNHTVNFPLDLDAGLTIAEQRELENRLQDIFNELSVGLCVSNHFFVFNIELTPPVDDSPFWNMRVDYYTFSDDDNLLLTGTGQQRRLSPIPVFGERMRHSKASRSFYGRRIVVESELENECLCARSAPSDIQGVSIASFNEVLDVALESDPDLPIDSIRVLDPNEIYFEMDETCPATDTLYDAFIGIQLSDTIIGTLNSFERQGLETSLEAAFVNATLTSCDRPFFRSLVESPNMIFPAEGSELFGTLGTTSYLVFQLGIASRGTPQDLTALHPPLPSEVQPSNRRLHHLCTLQEILDGPLACTSGGGDCDCARDGCYCPPEFTAIPRGATERELLLELNDFIQSGAPNALVRFQDELSLVELTELQEQQCSNDGGNDIQGFTVALIIFFDSDPSVLSNDENTIFEIAIRDIINDFNFEQCDTSFTTISDVNIISRNNNVPSGSRKHRALTNRRSYPLVSTVESRSRDRNIFRSGVRRTLLEERYSRANRSRSLLTLQEDGTVRCFCPAFGVGSGEAINAVQFVVVLNDEIEDGLLGDFRPMALEAVEAQLEDCPNNGIRVPVATTILVKFTESPTQQQINDLELDCLLGYNELSLRNCDPAFKRIANCTFLSADVGGPDVDPRGVLIIDGFGFTAIEDPIHFENNFRRLRESKKIEDDGQNGPYSDIGRALQDADLCFCPGGSDVERSEVSLIEFLEVTNTTGTMRDAVVVEEVPCEEGRPFSVLLSVTLTGVSEPLSQENLEIFERQLAETVNDLSIEGCDEANIFVTGALLVLDGFIPAVACGTVQLDGFCYGEGCENFVLGGDGRRLRSIERRMQRALSRRTIANDGTPSGQKLDGLKSPQLPSFQGRSPPERQLQSFEGRCYCSYESVRSNINQNVTLSDINTRLSSSIQSSLPGEITSVSLNPSFAASVCVVEEIVEECDGKSGKSGSSDDCGKSGKSGKSGYDEDSKSGRRRRRLNKKRSRGKRRRT